MCAKQYKLNNRIHGFSFPLHRICLKKYHLLLWDKTLQSILEVALPLLLLIIYHKAASGSPSKLRIPPDEEKKTKMVNLQNRDTAINLGNHNLRV